MSTKKLKSEHLETDYEQESHTARRKKAEIRESNVRKNMQDVYDMYGFDGEDEVRKYEHYVR